MAKCNSEDKMTVWGKMVCSEVCNSWFTARGHSISRPRCIQDMPTIPDYLADMLAH